MLFDSISIPSESILYSEETCPKSSSLTTDFNRVSGAEFKENVLSFLQDHSHRRDDISVFEDYERAECWIKDGGTAGFAMMPGYELVNLFSRSAGAGSEALEFAKIRYPRITLNCSGGKLEYFYGDHGFKVQRQEENWFSTPRKPLLPVKYMAWEKK